MRLLVLSIILFSNLTIAGEVRFRCTNPSESTCKYKIEEEVLMNNCGQESSDILCQAVEKDSAFYCKVKTAYCYSASSDGFMGVTCPKGDKKVILDSQLTADWARTFLWLWVRYICVE